MVTTPLASTDSIPSGVVSRLLLVLSLLLVTPLAAAADEVTVVVKQTSIRADKAFHARTLATAGFTEKLAVLATENNWFKVRHRKVTSTVIYLQSCYARMSRYCQRSPNYRQYGTILACHRKISLLIPSFIHWAHAP